eukprot:symbB.v1.2.009616.t1/scaffold587.1/size188863/6
MAWILLLLQLHGLLAASVLRRTKLVSETPHSADWFRSLGTDERVDTGDVPVQLAVQPQVSLEHVKPVKPVKPALRIPQVVNSENLKILQSSNLSTQNLTPTTPSLRVLRKVKGNLTCAQPGCAAEVMLQIYDPVEEYVRDCNLSLSVHATDFDDNFEGERVMNFMGNSRALGHDCYPEVNGCVSNQSRELLFSCISDHPVSTILTQEGNIKVSAQIAHTVDECPFNGNLLHGVTTVACYVGKLADLTTTPSPPETTTTTTHWSVAESFEKYPEWARKWLLEHPGMPLEDMPGYDSILNMSQFDGIPSPVGLEALPFRRNFSGLGAGEGAYGPYGPYGAYGNTNGEGDLGAGPGKALSDGSNLNLQTGGFLRCAEKGCKTNVLLDFNRSLVSINKCTLQLWLNQTDFDNLDGAVEFITIKVAGKEVLDKAKPGKNPCRSAYDGHPLTRQEIQVHALQDLDITEAVQQGPVNIAAEISKQVDECPSNGYLLDSSIQVSCHASSVAALLEQDKVSVADVLTLNKALLEPDLSEQDTAFKEFLSVAKSNTSATDTVLNAQS